MTLSITIDADGNAAIATVDKLGGAVKKTGAATEQMGAKSRKAAAETQGLGTKSGGAQAKVVALSAAQTRNAATAKAMGSANRVAAGNMGNLVAQFNDVGVMMAAGQNPLTLALQQGTQISQVIGPMGAAGAVKALGGAFMGMLNPISLMTIGVIGGGAALVQWGASAFGAGEKAQTFDDIIDDLTASVGDYRSLADLAASSTSDLSDRFGTAASSVKGVAGFLEEFARIEAIQEMDAAVDSLTERFGGLSRTRLVATRGGMISEMDRTFFELRDTLDLTDQQASAVIQRLEALADARTMSEKVTAANDLNAAFLRVFGSVDQIPVPLLNVAKEAGLIALQAGEITGAVKDTNSALASQYALYGNIRGESDAQLGSAQALLDKMNAQNELQAAIKVFGEGSVEVANLRAKAERDVLEEKLSTLDVSEAMKNELRLALSISQQIGTTDVGAGIRAAAADAADLARNIRLAASLGGEDDAMSVPVLPSADTAQQNNRAIANLRRLTTPKKTKQSPAARTTERERDAVMDLISGYEDELAILRELDPIQKEMLRNRETLSSASAAEKKQIEALIGARNAETQALEEQQEKWDATKDVAVGFFDDLRQSSGGLMGALDGVAGKLEDIVYQAILLGEGPLAQMLGTAGGGGIIGTILGGIFPGAAPAANLNTIPAKADGGKIYGPGSGTSDDVLMWGSNGEFMMTAKATKTYQPVLEMMNAGAFPSFAAGGQIGPTGSSGGFAMPAINFSIENRGSTPVKGNVTEESDGRGGRKMKLILADEVGAALSTPGGGAQKQLKGYGLRKRTASR